MAIIAKSSDTVGNPVSEGVHVAICIRVVELGDQMNERFGNVQNKIILTWEVPNDTVIFEGEERPKLISKEYTLSLGTKAKLREHLEAWRNKKFSEDELDGFDMINVLGKACQLQILHNDKGYASIGSVMSLPKGTVAPQAVNETIYFDLSSDDSLALMDKLPEWVRDKVKLSAQYLNLTSAQVDASEVDELEEVEPSDELLPF